VHFRLAELFAQIDNTYRPFAAAKGLVLRIAPASIVIYDDPLLLERILRNLVSNAVRYTDTGGIWIGFRRAGQRDGGYIEIRDSGVGFARSEQKRIRSGLNCATNAAHDAILHHGLGLATVRRLVGLMGGELKMRSAPGRGTTFRFPVRIGDASQVVTSICNARDAVVVRPPKVCRRILLAGEGAFIPEDSADRLGWVPQRVRDAAEALRVIDQEDVFDAVLCEFGSKLERRDTQALHAIRDVLARRSAQRPIMLVIMNDVVLSEAEDEATALDGIPVLHKPVTPVRLLRTLAALQPCGLGDARMTLSLHALVSFEKD
jgi:hypothetical protein